MNPWSSSKVRLKFQSGFLSAKIIFMLKHFYLDESNQYELTRVILHSKEEVPSKYLIISIYAGGIRLYSQILGIDIPTVWWSGSTDKTIINGRSTRAFFSSSSGLPARKHLQKKNKSLNKISTNKTWIKCIWLIQVKEIQGL